MFRIAATLGLICLPMGALAVGPEDDPPLPTQSTTTCSAGMIWDPGLGRCAVIRNSRLGDDALYRTARELAYAGRYEDAIATLGQMSDPTESRVLTTLGYAHRRAGRVDLGMAYYDRALAADPDNLLARAYLGQAHLLAGRYNMARRELDEIRARGGAGSWPETALDRAIAAGAAFSDY